MDEDIKSEIEKTVIKETAQDFSHRVEEFVYMQDVPYFEAINTLMEKSEYEPEFTSKLLTPVLKAKLALELEDVNLIKKTGKRRLF